MKIFVAGLWHLGCVTAACLAQAGYEVIGYDPNKENIARLTQGQAPLFEPGLDHLLLEGLASKRLAFTTLISDVHQADLLWITFDTPVDDHDEADVTSVFEHVKILLPYLCEKSLVIISSQLPVGTTSQLQSYCDQSLPNKKIVFAYLPENLRLEKAIEVFTHPDRIVIGLDHPAYREKIEELLQPFSDRLVWMSVCSAEMTKHAINAFLAVSVIFINELAVLCEAVGANAREVEQGLKSEERIGPKAYLKPGAAIGGGTLMRDIQYLIRLGRKEKKDTYLFSALLKSNASHKQWSQKKLLEIYKNLDNKHIAILGLTYKAGTDSLRRSTTLETCEWLNQQGCQISAYDPVVKQLPDQYAQFIKLKNNIYDAISAADAVIVSTAWPQFNELDADEFIKHLKQPVILDASGFISKKMQHDHRVQYFTVGVPS